MVFRYRRQREVRGNCVWLPLRGWEFQLVLRGVPQGSVLGLVLFIVFFFMTLIRVSAGL